MFKEEEEEVINIQNGVWKILIADDDKFIHRMIKEINRDLKFENKRIEFYSAYRSEEAISLIEENPDMSLVLLDVFIEAQDSGLKLVEHIREKIKNSDIRIVLMTGKGSMTLQEEAILNYDINGYENKTDLFSKKMSTIILSALRCYRDINKIKNNKLAMAEVVESISMLYETNSIEEFLSGNLHHLSAVINQGLEQKSCSINGFAAVKQGQTNIFNIVEGRGCEQLV